MSDLPLVDLTAQYRAIRGDVLPAIERVLERQLFISGPETAAFEEEFAVACEADVCIAVSSGTTALELTLEGLGVGPGDEVVTVSHTFFATVEAIVRVGATPVLVDVREGDWTIDPELVAAAVGPRTKAILPVHLYGHPADVPALAAAAPGIPIVEDAAQAHGARYHGLAIGSAAAAACFSFFPSKNLGAYGDAGAVITGDVELAARLRALRDHGRTSKYEHGSIGTNARVSELQAAVLRAKLPHLDAWVAARQRLAGLYEERLQGLGLGFQETRPWASHARHLFVVVHPDRDGLRDELRRAGIASGVHYPVPAHAQRALAADSWRVGSGFSVTEALAETVLSLPLYPELANADVDRVAHALETAVSYTNVER